jgi:cell division protein FtsB
MQTNIKLYRIKLVNALARLQDVRVVGLMLFLVVVLMMSWSGVKVIDTNYHLQKQIAELQQQNQLRQLENTNMRLRNDYFQTSQYQEIMARQNYGLAAPGETVLSAPKAVSLSYTVDRPAVAATAKNTANDKQPFYQRNFQAWMDFLLHRQAETKPSGRTD